MLRVYAGRSPKEALWFLQDVSNKELRKIQRLLFLPSMQGMAMQYDRKFPLSYWPKGNEKNDSFMGG
jgi:hypothetical protein